MTGGTSVIDRMAVEAAIREYMRAGGSFIFMKFSKLTKVPYDDVLRVSDYFAPYSKPLVGPNDPKRKPVGDSFPLGAVSALAVICTMESNRRQGLPI